MTITTEKDLLIQGVDYMSATGKINDTVVTDLYNYINAISNINGYELKYSMFDQPNSSGITFSDTNQTASTSGAYSLRTKPITLAGISFMVIKLIADYEDTVSLFLSTDGGTTFVGITDFNYFVNSLSSGYILKMTGGVTNVFKEIFILYS